MHPDIIPFSPKEEYSRRDFVMTALAGGFAAAVVPVSAETITTDSKGLTAGEVKIKVSDGEIPAYYAMPQEGKNLPTVLVVQEILGVHEHLRDICRRFAKEGYLAVAPELYARQGDVSKLKEIKDIFAIASKVPDSQVMADLDAAFAWAEKNGGNASKVAVTGFCWGGRITWMYAAHNPRLKAGVAWYGALVRPASPLAPTHPIDIAAKLKVPVLGLYGDADTGISVDSVEAMREALKKAGSVSEIVLYDDVPHGFYADYRPSYRPSEAKDGWKRLMAWFRKYGAA